MQLDDETFEKLIGEVMDQLPEKYVSGLDNVLVTYEDDPSPQQREQLKLRCNQTLFGLYEGIPRTQRNNNYTMVLPDRITLFKNPILHVSTDMVTLQAQIHNTLWHEIAHHYGLDHDQIHALQR